MKPRRGKLQTTEIIPTTQVKMKTKQQQQKKNTQPQQRNFDHYFQNCFHETFFFLQILQGKSKAKTI